MNERIGKLAEQAGLLGPTSRVGNSHEATEKFAELLIKECIEIVKPTSHHEVWAQGYLGGVDGLELLGSKVKQIKQHFGVEE